MMMRIKTSYIIIAILAIMVFVMSTIIDSSIKEKKRLTANLTEKTKEWVDERGRYVSEVSQLKTNEKELKEIFKKDSSQMASNYEKRIYSLKKEIKSLGLYIDELEEITTGTIVIKDTIMIPATVNNDSIIQGNYESTYLSAEITYFVKKNDFELDYTTMNRCSVIRTLSAKRKKNGKRHFILPKARWLWGTEERVIMVCDNKKSKVTLDYSVKIED